MRRKNGFTLVEIVITMAVLAIVVTLAGSVILDTMRMVSREEAVLQMDQDANRIMETVRLTLRGAYIPVAVNPLDLGRKAAIEGTSLAANVQIWRQVLATGTDLIVFLVPLDAGGAGDTVYGSSQANMRLILGVETPENSAAVPNGQYEATDAADNLGNLGLVDLDPVAHLGLASDNAGAIDITAARFAHPFVYPPTPGGRRHVYGVIRFAPTRQGNATVALNEATIGQDLNGDGDETDQFVLGHMEIVYPNSAGGVFTQAISTESVLLQVNRDDVPQDSIFQLWPVGTGGNNIKMHLLLCNFLGQQDPLAFKQGGFQFITRTFETQLKTQLMAIN